AEQQRAEAERLAAEQRAQAEREAAAVAAAAAAAERAAREQAEQAARAAAAAAAERLAAQQRAEAERLAAEQRAQAERAAAQAAQAAQAAEAAAASAAAAGAAAAATPAATGATRELRTEETLVLVADDSKIVRVKLSRLLAGQGYRVAMAESGEQALELLAAERPHLLITDVEMPGIDGFELTRQVRANPVTAELPVVMITGSDDKLEQARAAGVTQLLGKPYPEATLIASIESARLATRVPA
ncbi:hypothetical protein DBR42_06010, partial [Pelomonas sp. HMWF004]